MRGYQTGWQTVCTAVTDYSREQIEGSAAMHTHAWHNKTDSARERERETSVVTTARRGRTICMPRLKYANIVGRPINVCVCGCFLVYCAYVIGNHKRPAVHVITCRFACLRSQGCVWQPCIPQALQNLRPVVYVCTSGSDHIPVSPQPHPFNAIGSPLDRRKRQRHTGTLNKPGDAHLRPRQQIKGPPASQ